MNFPLFIPPHHAQRYKDEELGINYSQWVDREDRDHISGTIAKEHHGVWVSKPGFRLRIFNNEVQVYKKKTTIIEDLDAIDEIIEEVEGKNGHK